MRTGSTERKTRRGVLRVCLILNIAISKINLKLPRSPAHHAQHMTRGKRPAGAISDAKKFAERMGYRWQENTDNP